VRGLSDAVLVEKFIIKPGFGYHGSHVLDTFDRWWAGCHVLPEITVPKDFFNDVLFFNKPDNFHSAAAWFVAAHHRLWTLERIDFVYRL
jgi:hypothetical protein